MGIRVDLADGGALTRLAAPPVRVRHEEQLLLREMIQAWQVLVPVIAGVVLPGLESGRQATGVRNVLPQSQAAVDMKRLAIRSLHRVLGILVDEAFCALCERLDSGFCPPLCQVTVLVIIAA